MPLIELRGLTKIYRMGETDVRALDGVTLDVEKGEFVAITGASGSGKSTMMHLLGCLDRPTAGSYQLDGRAVSGMSDRELARIRNKYIGFVFQTFNLINRTSAMDNVGVPLFYGRQSNTRDAARTALERVGLGQRYKHKPSELSGGERQRVAIARAIVNDPVLLFADEPTGNLDSRTGEQIMEIFRELNEQGVTVVLVTHEPDVAMQAKRIVQMRDGNIVSDRLTADLPPVIAGYAHPPEIMSGAQQAPPSRPAASPPAVAGAPSDLTDRYAALPATMAKGATGAMTIGLVAIAMLIIGVIAGIAASLAGWKPDPVNPKALPPPHIIALGLTFTLSIFLAIICALIAIFWGRGVLHRIRSEPGNWLGAGRARIGALCGWATVLLPILYVGLNLTLKTKT